MKRLVRRWTPASASRTALAALTVGCLVIFALTLLLPRIDDQLVGSDGTRYYVYLPSVWLDGDLDFADEYSYLFAYHPQAAAHIIADHTPTGLPKNRFGIGPAVVWTPYFAVAHGIAWTLTALGWDIGTDGMGLHYQAIVLAGSILSGGLGIWLAFGVARRSSNENAALVATLLVVLAGNAIYYLTIEPSMSHAPSLLASGLFFTLWMRHREEPGTWSAARLGGAAGLMALIRPQDGLLLALPVLDELFIGRHWAARLRHILLFAITAFAVFSPQLVVWKILNGGYLTSGYAEEFDVLFQWTSPHLANVLFSAHRGLFTWHPVFLLVVPGLIALARRDRRLAALCALGLGMQWWVISSWHDWAQGDAFGGRMFITCTPIFVLATAAFAARFFDDESGGPTPAWRVAAAVGGLLILLNVLLLLHYRLEILPSRQPLTYAELFFGRFRLGF